MGEALEIAKVMVDPIKKLIEALQSAIGKVYEPRHIRNMADAKAYEISTVGQAMREFCDIPATYHDGQIQLDTTDSESLVERTKSRLAFQELTKQNNIESVVDQSYQMLEGEPMVSNEPVDQGWMLRFMDSVGDISDSDLQRLWAKILSGEIKQPKSYSLRTLDTLRNMSSNEAKLFEQICDYVIVCGNYCFLPHYESLEKIYNISYGSLLRLEECGLINTDGMIRLNLETTREKGHIANNNRIAIAIEGENNHTNIPIAQYPLTAVGKEIYKLFSHDLSDSYLLDFARELKKGRSGVKISAHRVIEITADYIRTENEDLLTDD